MGKSRGGKYHKGRGKNDEEEEEVIQNNQRSNVGLMPPSDSDSESDDGDAPSTSEAVPKAVEPAKAAVPVKQAAKKADDSDDDSEEDSDSDDDPTPSYLTAPPPPRKKVDVEERSPEQIRKDLERLELIRKKREDDRKKRIADEGWDRFAPMSETNKPPGHVIPSDHPSRDKDKA